MNTSTNPAPLDLAPQDVLEAMGRIAARHRGYTAERRQALELAAIADAEDGYRDITGAGRNLRLEVLLPNGSDPEPDLIAVESITGRLVREAGPWRGIRPGVNASTLRSLLKRWAVRRQG
jgi:hypothetical protein